MDKIVRIPVPALLDSGNYARYRITVRGSTPGNQEMQHQEMPCFVHRHEGHEELLWGATYRITEQFLKIVFGFIPPSAGTLPVFHRRLGRNYLEGGPPS